jgi:polyhydroxyalkanoate synthesis regulator phasin
LGVRLRVRLESQLAQVIQAIGTMQQNMATKQDLAAVRQDITAVQNNVNALHEDVISLRQRIDSVEGAVSIVIRNTFTAHQNFVDDLNFDLTNSERKIRRLGRRVARLERQYLDD